MDSWKLQLWRRLSPGKNPPLMLEHLGFHPTPPSFPPPPSFPCLYISPHQASVLFWSWRIFIPASRAFGGQNTGSLNRRRGKRGEPSRCLLHLLFSLAVPTHQTPLTHGIDPRGAHTCPGKATQTNLPPQCTLSVSPSISITALL